MSDHTANAPTTLPRKLGDPRTHFWLAQRMAKEVGVDLNAQTRQGHLDQADWAAMITRCRGCEWANGCATWLEQQNGGSDVPSSCVNVDQFRALKAQTR